MYSYTAKIGQRGLLTIPAALRRELRLKPGDRIDFIDAGNRSYIFETDPEIG